MIQPPRDERPARFRGEEDLRIGRSRRTAEARSIFRRLGIRPRGSRGQSRFGQRVERQPRPETRPRAGERRPEAEVADAGRAANARGQCRNRLGLPMPGRGGRRRHRLALVNERPRVPISVLPSGPRSGGPAFRAQAEPSLAGPDNRRGQGGKDGPRLCGRPAPPLITGFGFDGDVVSRHHRSRMSTTGRIKPTHRGSPRGCDVSRAIRRLRSSPWWTCVSGGGGRARPRRSPRWWSGGNRPPARTAEVRPCHPARRAIVRASKRGFRLSPEMLGRQILESPGDALDQGPSGRSLTSCIMCFAAHREEP